MASSWVKLSLIAFLLAGFLISTEVAGLRCYACRDGSCPSKADTQEQTCGNGQDTCFKFEGDVTSSGRLSTGLTTRGCVAYSILRQYPPIGIIQQNACSNVTASRDPYKPEIYTGRFCLCNTDLCNMATMQFASSTILAVALVLVIFRNFASSV